MCELIQVILIILCILYWLRVCKILPFASSQRVISQIEKLWTLFEDDHDDEYDNHGYESHKWVEYEQWHGLDFAFALLQLHKFLLMSASNGFVRNCRVLEHLTFWRCRSESPLCFWCTSGCLQALNLTLKVEFTVSGWKFNCCFRSTYWIWVWIFDFDVFEFG